MVCSCASPLPRRAQDRGRFIQSYQSAEQQLKDILRRHGKMPAGNNENDMCRMM